MPLHFSQTVTLDMPADAFFQAATMTDRVQRLSGLPRATQHLDRDPDGRPAVRVSMRLAGLPVAWYELPFEWVEGQFWRSRPVFPRGPVAWATFTTWVRPLAADRTEIQIDVAIGPRY